MALSPQLLQFKSSGVYRLEFDKSQTTNIPAGTIRLVVGHSNKGPYNTPVLISTTEQFIEVFGSIDKNLEKKGMFFHRSALATLTRGPILALNTATFQSTDTANYLATVTDGSNSVAATVENSSAYTNFYNTEKFWYPSDDALNDVVGTGLPGAVDASLLRFVNIKQDDITIVIRKAQSTAGFDILARDWYGEGKVPSYINSFDYLSDFMVEVFVFKGQFNAATMANDPVYGDYFTADGLDKTKLAEFANLRQVTLLAQYTGSMLPGFIDKEGNNVYIETQINAEARRTGLFCAVDEDAVLADLVAGVNNVDLVGHVYTAGVANELLSYAAAADTRAYAIDAAYSYDRTSGAFVTYTAPTTTAPVVSYNPTAIALPAAAYNASAVSISGTGSILVNFPANDGGGATGENNRIIILGQDATASISVGDYLLDTNGTYQIITSVAYTVTNTYVDIQQSVSNIYPLDAGYAQLNGGSINAYTLVPVTTSVLANTITFTGAFNPATAGISSATPDYILDAAGTGYVAVSSVTSTTIVTAAAPNAVYDAIDTTSGAVNINKYTEVTTPGGATAPLSLLADDYILAGEAGRLVKILRIAKSIVGANTIYKVYVSAEAAATGAYDSKGYQSYETNATHYKTFVMGGASVAAQSILDCLTMLTLGTGLANALIDKDNITYRYIVDTFASFENSTILNKVQLSALAKARQNASALLNAPQIAEFKKSTDPSFTDSNGNFQISYITTGGNLDKNPTALYSLPSINDGANYAFYYTALVARENNKDFIVPSAAYVSNNFVDKFTESVPWAIVAGPRRGVVAGSSIIAAEYAFDKSDRDVIEPFGINPIVFQRGAGLTILGNKTAQQSVQSALSSAHVREVLIYIQDGMAAILQNYVFEFNTAQTRLEIKTLADSFMESVKADFGVYDYKNVMDTTNNTNEVIDANIGILDTFVEPVKGLEIVVHRTTVLNTGEIATGNFN